VLDVSEGVGLRGVKEESAVPVTQPLGEEVAVIFMLKVVLVVGDVVELCVGAKLTEAVAVAVEAKGGTPVDSVRRSKPHARTDRGSDVGEIGVGALPPSTIVVVALRIGKLVLAGGKSRVFEAVLNFRGIGMGVGRMPSH